MSANPLSPAEAAIVARFEMAQPAPESWQHPHHWIGTHNHGPVCSVCGISKPEDGDEGLRERVRELANELDRQAPDQEAWDGNVQSAYVDIAKRIRQALDGPV